MIKYCCPACCGESNSQNWLCKDCRTKLRKSESFFNELTDDEKEIVMAAVGEFHFRNGVEQEDGSKGVIKITQKQLNNCLALMLTIG